MKVNRLMLTAALLACWLTAVNARSKSEISLAGTWAVALDSLDRGINEGWQQREFADAITLPGTLCEAGYGTPCATKAVMEKETFLDLKRKYDYVGPAWYRREVEVPADWRGSRVTLLIERVLWQSQVWVNGRKADGFCESLTTPHRFDVGTLLRPGERNVIVIRIDNRMRHDISTGLLAHAYTNATQTLWNGMLGRMALVADDEARIEELRLVPDVENGRVSVRVSLSAGGKLKRGRLTLSLRDPSGKAMPDKVVEADGGVLEFDYDISEPVLWDEFNPALYEATATLEAKGVKDVKSAEFGMRRLTADGRQLKINGRRLFLRGTLECCVFPLLGYPPTDEAGWQKVFATAKSYGLNHLRFHSWCPPEAAFRVADRMGFYLQVELPVWSLDIGKEQAVTDFLRDEGMRIIREYGNHPSFCFWSMGNELQSDFRTLDGLMTALRREDPRHLYTTTTFTFEKGHGDWPEPNDDFWISQWTKKGWVRGQGVFDDRPVSFDTDYSASVEGLPVPIVTHEVGQYSVYPDLKEISKYTGNLVPVNFMAVKRDLELKGRTEWAEQNLMASGKLAAILYKVPRPGHGPRGPARRLLGQQGADNSRRVSPLLLARGAPGPLR